MSHYIADWRNYSTKERREPGLQIYLRSRITLTFDLLTRKVEIFVLLPLPHAPIIMPISINIGSFVEKYSVNQFGRQTDGRTDKPLCIRRPH